LAAVKRMSAKRTGGWLAWGVLLVVFASVAVLVAQLFRRSPTPVGPALHVEGEAGWPRTLIERSPDGTESARLVLPRPPQRIVSVTVATDEFLLDMVPPERIAALSELAPKTESRVADRLGPIRHFVGTDVESIIALNPDLCFLANYNRRETRSLLVDSGIPVFVFRRFRSLQDIRDNLHTVGWAVGAEQAAERLLADMDRQLAEVAERLPPTSEWPSALVYSQSGWVEGAGTMQTALFEAAGLRSSAAEAGIAGSSKVSEELVLEMDPDYLVIAREPIEMADHREWLMGNPALAPLKAIRQERFLVLDESLLTTVSHHVGDAVAELARQAYPNRFPSEHE
jgi:iron complex transport system substrate-binding protein